MYGIEEINMYINNLSHPTYIHVDIKNKNIIINERIYEYKEDDVKTLLRIIRLWKDNDFTSSNLDDESIEINIKGSNFEEMIRSRVLHLENYNQFRKWVMHYYE